MASTSSGFISTIYKTRKVLLELLELRGYNIEDYNNFTIGEINILVEKEQLDLLLEKDDGTKIYVKYFLSAFKKEAITNIVNMYFKDDEEENVLDIEKDELLFITLTDPNDTIRKIINHYWDSESIYITVMSLKRLKFNILNHTLVPPHRILNSIEVEEFKEKYSIKNKDSEIPEISRTDPVSVAIGLKPGEVCEITRNSKTSISTKYYRVCI